jgi:hypothetical protein
MLRQRHFRFRTDTGAVDATPSWGAAEDTNYVPGSAAFRLRFSIENPDAEATGSLPFQIYVSKNGGAYAPVTTSSTNGIKSIDAGSDADNTTIVIPRLTTPVWTPLSGAAIDLDFQRRRYYSSSSLADIALTSVLSISRASTGYATNADGTLTSFGTGTLRNTDLGLLIEDARSNVVLWNRDLSNAAWTKTNITAAKDQTGADGAATSASSLLATSANGTVLQSITLGSAAAFQSAYVKRLVGTGTINMTMDNGATWTAIVPTSNWTLLSIPTQTLANPTVGFRIVTSGDQIAVDFVQNENGTFASSPIPTTTTAATRAADAITATGALSSLLSALPQSAYADIIAEAAPTGFWRGVGAFGSVAYDQTQLFMNSSNTVGGTYNGTVALTATLGGSLTFTSAAKIAVAQDGSGRSFVGGGGTVATDASAGVVGLGTVAIGSGTAGNTTMFGYIRRLAVWNSKIADATLQALTAP